MNRLPTSPRLTPRLLTITLGRKVLEGTGPTGCTPLADATNKEV